ncbi:hypothetical protein niasHS_006916 [Heterodera schachtii]|uniref:Metalloendopeptidase n=1 Tax=Heterodera schachtii TaxID=97005 RepID=A0ABD2JG30_HETSC
MARKSAKTEAAAEEERARRRHRPNSLSLRTARRPSVPMALAVVLPLFLILPSTDALIRNNRVILHDEYLPPGEIGEEMGETNAKRRETEEQGNAESDGRRPRVARALGNSIWWGDKWRRKAATNFGQSEAETERIRLAMERLKEGIEEEEEKMKGKSQRKKNQRNGEGTAKGGETEEMTEEQWRELREWSARRVSDDGGATKKRGADEWPEEGGRHFEGDIVLSADQADALLEETFARRRRAKRKFIGSKVRRWDVMKPIVYSFDGSHTLREQRVIELALEHWHNITCLNFERRNDEPKGSRIVFTDVDGCASNVGRHPLGEPQFVSLAPECIRLGVIAHEVAHALGFWHEQSRPDRDQFVQVQWENIDRDSKGQFLKEQPADVDNGGVPYDYGSIMHYRSKAFAKYDDLFTIGTAIGDYQRTIGQRDQLSFNDIRLMNEIYCKAACPRQLPCQRGGYTDPRHCDRCRCPDGFTGTFFSHAISRSFWAGFREGQECSWLLVAPPNQRVHFNFYGEFEMYCKVRHSLCMDYVEIRNSTDFANTGMRYCCFGTPESPIVSDTRDMLVLFRSFYRGGKGFQARARAVAATDAPLGAWSEWSECSASCGACGVRRRVRECAPRGDAVCLTELSQTEVCARRPCASLCARSFSEEAPCEGILSLLKGLRCRTERTRMEPCRRMCCAGYTVTKMGEEGEEDEGKEGAEICTK